MNIVYHNRTPDSEAAAQLGASYASLPDLLAQSDFVVLTVPLTAQTQGMIGRKQLKQMKSSAYLVNVARGPVVDHDALNNALGERWIRGAALDVTDPEPLPREHPLLQHDNVIITPHLGSAARQTRVGMERRTIENLLAGLNRQPLLNRVI